MGEDIKFWNVAFLKAFLVYNQKYGCEFILEDGRVTKVDEKF